MVAQELIFGDHYSDSSLSIVPELDRSAYYLKKFDIAFRQGLLTDCLYYLNQLGYDDYEAIALLEEIGGAA